MNLVFYHGTSVRNLKRIWNEDYEFGLFHAKVKRFVLDFYPEIREPFAPRFYDIADRLEELGGIDAGSCITSLEHFVSGTENTAFAFGDFYATTSRFAAYRYAWRRPEILDVLRGLSLLIKEYSPRYQEIRRSYASLFDEWSVLHDPVVIELIVDDLSRVLREDGRMIRPTEVDILNEDKYSHFAVRVLGFSKTDITGIYDVRNLGDPYQSMDPDLFVPRFKWVGESAMDSFLLTV